jgi:hypothetical protein
MKKMKSKVTMAALFAALTGLSWWNYTVLEEAFGNGPPYYGRTANMDKWSNPVPVLLMVDFSVLLAAGLVGRLVSGSRDRPKQVP